MRYGLLFALVVVLMTFRGIAVAEADETSPQTDSTPMSQSGLAPISMIRLIADPDMYNGKEVVVFGVFVVATDENKLYFSPADADAGNFSNSLTLRFDEKASQYRPRTHELNFKWVAVRGIFDSAVRSSFLAALSPGIRDIKEITLINHYARAIRAYGQISRLLPTVVVPDEQTAVAIARAIWTPVYGKVVVAQQEPITAELRDGVWTAGGVLRKGESPDSHLVAWIEQSNAEILMLMPRQSPPMPSAPENPGERIREQGVLPHQ